MFLKYRSQLIALTIAAIVIVDTLRTVQGESFDAAVLAATAIGLFFGTMLSDLTRGAVHLGDRLRARFSL